MALSESREITAFLEHRADDYLRSVVYFDEDRFELLYIRDDVRDQYSDDEIRDVIEDLRWQSYEKIHHEELYVHGDLRCTVRCFEEAVEMHFPHDKQSGTAVALDPEAATELYAFLGECIDHLQTL